MTLRFVLVDPTQNEEQTAYSTSTMQLGHTPPISPLSSHFSSPPEPSPLPFRAPNGITVLRSLEDVINAATNQQHGLDSHAAGAGSATQSSGVPYLNFSPGSNQVVYVLNVKHVHQHNAESNEDSAETRQQPAQDPRRSMQSSEHDERIRDGTDTPLSSSDRPTEPERLVERPQDQETLISHAGNAYTCGQTYYGNTNMPLRSVQHLIQPEGLDARPKNQRAPAFHAGNAYTYGQTYHGNIDKPLPYDKSPVESPQPAGMPQAEGVPAPHDSIPRTYWPIDTPHTSNERHVGPAEPDKSPLDDEGLGWRLFSLCSPNGPCSSGLTWVETRLGGPKAAELARKPQDMEVPASHNDTAYTRQGCQYHDDKGMARPFFGPPTLDEWEQCEQARAHHSIPSYLNRQTHDGTLVATHGSERHPPKRARPAEMQQHEGMPERGPPEAAEPVERQQDNEPMAVHSASPGQKRKYTLVSSDWRKQFRAATPPPRCEELPPEEGWNWREAEFFKIQNGKVVERQRYCPWDEAVFGPCGYPTAPGRRWRFAYWATNRVDYW